jgi:hypothetical protein
VEVKGFETNNQWRLRILKQTLVEVPVFKQTLVEVRVFKQTISGG